MTDRVRSTHTLVTGGQGGGTAAARAARRAETMAAAGAVETPREEADPEGLHGAVPDGVPFAVVAGPMGPGVHGPMLPRILERIRGGCPRSVAAQSCGVPKRVISVWMSEHEWLREAIEGAEGEAINTMVSLVYAAAQRGQWQAAAWIAERRWPQHFARVEGNSALGDSTTTDPVKVAFTFDEGEAATG